MTRREFVIGWLEAFLSPFTGRWIDRTRCGLCEALLPLPGEYPLMVEREEPDAKVVAYSEASEMPEVIQTGLVLQRPVCWAHVQ